MMRSLAVLLGLFAVWQAPAPTPAPALTSAALTADSTGWVDLLADKSLKPWTRVALGAVGQLPPGDLSRPSPWTFDAAHGVLLCEGDKSGHEMFRFAQEVGDFVLHVEWRYAGPPDEKAYNSGVFARASADGATWHQAQTGTGGGYLFVAMLVDGKTVRVNLRDKMAENRVKPAGEWNVYEIRATGRTLTLWVNGAVVSESTNGDVPRGFIGLEAEGYRMEFRNLKLKVLTPAGQDQGAGKPSAVPQTPEWQKLTSLVGQWDGAMVEGGNQMPATLEVRMTGDGSAIMHVLGKGSPYEMVTMIHPDGKRLLATHYCAAHNQPRMALVPSKAANQVAFDFVDGTNIAPGEGHMKGVVFTLTDADHHEEAWTSSAGPGAALFKFTRKK